MAGHIEDDFPPNRCRKLGSILAGDELAFEFAECWECFDVDRHLRDDGARRYPLAMPPFKLRPDPPARDPFGRYQPKTQASPPQVFERSLAQDKPPLQVVAEVRVADHPTPPNQPQAPEEFEPPQNESPGKPYRLK